MLDFGLVLDRHPTAEELEDEQRFVGTPAVMAPEMVRFQAPVDARADIYALGCVGYWLLTGKRVFDAETRHDLLGDARASEADSPVEARRARRCTRGSRP